ncbi:hypothetical protein TWF730_009180 [Orbilia blumenaviensis]|uniref:Uncharacterized protein n=1 Tax=Orbilia blumenaviensis TaxID=1796055 RepID=A0AAV9UYG0_9PEZI
MHRADINRNTWVASGGRQGVPRMMASGRPNPTLTHSGQHFCHTQGNNAQRKSIHEMPMNGNLSIHRWRNQDSTQEPANARMGVNPRGNVQTDHRHSSDAQNNYDGSFTFNGMPATHSGPIFQTSYWMSVPGAPSGNQTQPDIIQAPSAPVVPRAENISPDAEGETGRKRSRTHAPNLSDIKSSHKYYSYFNYSEYQPPKSAKGTAMGTRSLDHHPDNDLQGTYASYLFQNDPIKYWTLRDVAEKVPTKIREKEIAYFKQLGVSSPYGTLGSGTNGAGTVDVTGDVADINAESSANPKKKEKKARTGQDGGPIPKGRRNWNENYKKNFPGAPLPSSKPNWRPTVHALLHAGKSDDGPQDFNSLVVNALKRCEADPEFLSLLIQKVESCCDPQNSPASGSESTGRSDELQGQFDSHSQNGAGSDDAPTDASSLVRRVSRNPSVRSGGGGVYRQDSHGQRRTSNPNSIPRTNSPYAQQLQTNFTQNFSFTDNQATSASGTGTFLSPMQISNPLNGVDMRDDVSSFLGSADHDQEPGPVFSHAEGSIASGLDMFQDQEPSIPFPYPEDLESEDIKMQ